MDNDAKATSKLPVPDRHKAEPDDLERQLLSERYIELKSRLAIANEGLCAGETLEAGLFALNAVTQFLEGDPSALGLSASILAICNALNDVIQGARPDLFNRPKTGRPTSLARHAARAPIVWCLNVLIAALKSEGRAQPEAGRILAAELKKAELCEGGEGISSSKLMRWRDEMGARAPELTDDIYKLIVPGLPPVDAPRSVHEARLLVREVLARVKLAGF